MLSREQIKQKMQEVFDVTVEKLAAQGERSGEFDDEGQFSCLYRGPHGLKCAVGHWIPDSAYDVRMENKTVTALRLNFGGQLPEILLDDNLESLFQSLQSCHDSRSKDAFADTESFRENFGHVASLHYLSTARLNELVLMVPETKEA